MVSATRNPEVLPGIWAWGMEFLAGLQDSSLFLFSLQDIRIHSFAPPASPDSHSILSASIADGMLPRSDRPSSFPIPTLKAILSESRFATLH